MKRLILLVEDNEELLQVSQRALEFHGYQVAVAKNGLEAVKLATSQLPDAILMDLYMPEMDGLEATCRIRSDSRTKDIPIVATTASARAGEQERCLAVGCNDYLQKPYTYPELTAAIRKALEERESKVA
ncbi:MAG TPA: response regulator [Candidatus Binatia bacterium]|nr:response regulator [Candidatus Binatia bacterium]